MDVCCIIKPTAFNHTAAIYDVFARAGMPIRERKDISFTTELVHKLYDHMPDTARAAIAADLDGKPGIALRVVVPSLEALLDVAGRETDPRACAFGTIRWRFGTHENPHDRGGTPWWENALHRPVNDREAVRDLRLLFP